MTIKSIAAAIVAVLLAAIPGAAQTAAELLQKGIYAQETSGDLDAAIQIYRQIVNSAPSQREIAAQAQYRLAQALLQKGDLTEASREFERLARDYAEYRNLVSSLSAPGGRGRGGRGGSAEEAQRAAMAAELAARLGAAQPGGRGGPPLAAGPGVPGGRSGPVQGAALAGMSFDHGSPITVRGKAVQIAFINPVGFIVIDDGTSQYMFATAAPRDLERQGFIRTTIQLGEEVTVTGVLANDGNKFDGLAVCPKSCAAASANAIIKSDGSTVFSRAAIAK
jgi:hypothetical protein